MKLDGAVVLLTGGKRMGGTIGAALAARGADVAFSYGRSQGEADAAADQVRAVFRRSVTVQADVTDAASCRALIESVVASLGRLDVLINMASVYRERPFDDLSAEDWDAQLRVDLRATFLCSHAAVPHLRAQGGGRIINFGDWVARSGRPRYRGYVPYYVAKAGVIALTEALALELAGDNILVNAIAPGPILAPSSTTEQERQAVEDATPLGRWGGEQEIAKAIVALIDSDFITGETIRVDGGRHLR
jgi:NAD(P)-dependent dehydrogenase (short-subunit alcohol dehydrogenase family)